VITRRDFLFPRLSAPVAEEGGPRARRPEPEVVVPPEVAERAARFRAELAARRSSAPPAGPVVWQEAEPSTTTPVPPWRR
jgi:hypothetical protein